jgi:formamidopyrimidine-DNA glycosylase
MPELPDVEVFRRYFDATSLKQKIEQVDVLDKRILEEATENSLRAALIGTTFTGTRRHGKFMFAETDSEPWLVLHYGMTGFLSYVRNSEEQPSHTRVLFSFEGGNHLAFVDQRILGLASVTTDPDAFIAERDLGPDAFALKPAAFRDILQGRRGAVKSAITNQNVISGIGNIYADEILFQSKIHPKRALAELSGGDLKKLHQQTRKVLQAAIDAEVDVDRMPKRFLLRQRDSGGPCPRCGSELATTKVSSRTTLYCPACQPEA